jgi:hypothetical protein
VCCHVSDVIESINAFQTARQFNVVGASKGIAKMVTLVWSREQAIKDK